MSRFVAARRASRNVSGTTSLAFDGELTASAEAIGSALRARGQTLAIVECSLGGALGHVLTNVPGASSWLAASLTPYSAAAKTSLLGTDADSFGADGAVSASGARVMADAIRARVGADWGFAESGILGPRGARRSAKAPGLGFLCLVGPTGEVSARTIETGHDDRLGNKRAFVAAALDLIRRAVEPGV